MSLTLNRYPLNSYFAELTLEQEVALLSILKAQKKAIGWTIIDIKGINPALC